MSITNRNASVDAWSMAAAVSGSVPAGGGLSGWTTARTAFESVSIDGWSRFSEP